MTAEELSPLSIGEYLKTHTRSLHTELDQLAPLRRLAKGQFTREEYVRSLHGFYSAYLSVEHAMRCAPTYEIDKPGYQTRLPALKKELAMYSALQPEQIIHHTLVLSAPGAYWGARYVLEGSSLGARYLLPRIQAGLDLDSDLHLYFFRQLVSQSHNWARFLSALEQHLANKHHRQQAAESARETFSVFKQSFSQME